MKTFGLLSIATVLLVGVGYFSGAFTIDTDISQPSSCDGCESCSGCQDSTVATSDGEEGSCCSSTDDQEKSSCCGSCDQETTTSTSTEKDSCCSSTEDSAVSTSSEDCQSSCADSDGSCCQDGVSRVSAIVAQVAGADANVAAGSQPVAKQEESSQEVTTGDWSMWGGTIGRNMVNEMTGVKLDFDLQKGERVNWVANLGSQTYGNAIVAGGKVFVGCNNGAGYRADIHPADQDKGCILCFDEATGDFLWQLTREKLTRGRVSDWPLQGICSTPAIELSESEESEVAGRMWVVTNRCELMCLDIGGLRNGNAGPYTEEVDSTEKDADIIWNYDMIDELGVFPHNLATSSPVIYGDLVYILTSNGVDEAHLELPSPRSPSFLAFNKNTGELVWEANQPGGKVLHGQWSSPTIGVVNGKAQVYFPGGDGWVYAHDALSGEEIWRFDMNPKNTEWELGGRGSRNAVISTGVFQDNSLVIAVGQDPEHGEGVGHLWRIDCTKTGDISPELGEIGSDGEPNPNSGVIWHYGGTNDEGETVFRRTMSTVSIVDGMCFAVDLSGFVHCVDFDSGARYWEEDLLTGVWGSTMVADGKVFLGSEDGTLFVFAADKAEGRVLKKFNTINYSSIYSTPTIANGRMYLTDRTRLYSIQLQGDAEKKDD